MNQKKIIYGAAGAALLILAAVFFMNRGGGDAGLPQGGSFAADIKPSDMIHGSPDAPVTIIEYASMTCSHCADFQRIGMPQLVEDYIDTGKVKLIFREYPLDAMARRASALARCHTGENYFSFIELLLLNQAQWIQDRNGDQQFTMDEIDEGLVEMGRIAGMSRERVEACMNDEANLALVDENWREAQTRYNVGSTPTFVIGGTVYPGIQYEQVKDIIDSLLADG